MNTDDRIPLRNAEEQKSSGLSLPDPAPRKATPSCIPGTPLNVVLMDDRQLNRESLRALIHAVDPNIRVCEATSPVSIQKLVHNTPLPSVLVANIAGTGKDRLHLLDHIRGGLPEAPLGVLTELSDAVTVRSLLNKGIRGVLSPDTPGDVFVGAIRMLAVGGTYIPTALLWGDPNDDSDSAAAAARIEKLICRAYPALSRRQATILRLMAKGLSNQEIADTLNIRPNTVKVHVHNVFDRLKIHRRAEAERLVRQVVEAAESNSQQGNM